MIRKIRWLSKAEREFGKLPRQIQIRIMKALEKYAATGYGNVRAMVGSAGKYRLRVQNYRVVFRLEDKSFVVLVVDIGHRKEIYR